MLMCSAEFWEMSKLKGAIYLLFLSLLVLTLFKEAITINVIARTAFLDGFDLETLLTAVGKDTQKFDLPGSHQLNGLKPTLRFLLSSPLEYLPRVVRTMLHRRLMIADILVSCHIKDMAGDERALISTLLREFLLQKPKEQKVCLSRETTITMVPKLTNYFR